MKVPAKAVSLEMALVTAAERGPLAPAIRACVLRPTDRRAAERKDTVAAGFSAVHGGGLVKRRRNARADSQD